MEAQISVRLRFLGALGQAAACLYIITWRIGRKAQWLVEEINENLSGKPIVWR